MATASSESTIGDYVIDMDARKCLGQGQYGMVFRGKHVETGDPVAAKLCNWMYVTEETNKEAEMMKNIHHDSCTKILDYIEIEKEGKGKEKEGNVEVWMIMDYCKQGNLLEYVRRTPSLTLAQKHDIMLQCARGLQHLHQQKPSITHRDVKPQNILVGGDTSHPCFKLADFGTAKYLDLAHEHSVRQGTVNIGK